MKKYRKALHIFHRDLRLVDNTALRYALTHADEVMPCFIFDVAQVEQNDYKSMHALIFMCQALQDLHDDLQQHNGTLHIFYGNTDDIVQDIITHESCDLVTTNRDYTPFAQQRDSRIEMMCHKNNISYACFADCLLVEPEVIHKDDGEPYTVFTPFYRKARHIAVEKPRQCKGEQLYVHHTQLNTKSLDDICEQIGVRIDAGVIRGGRREGIKLLHNISRITNYSEQRDVPYQDGTTHLSAHHKFGTISIRETYHATVLAHGIEHDVIKELYWRDFFTHIAYHFPHVFGRAFRAKYDQIPWENDLAKFIAWQDGKTGFPIVDAGMRELKETGYMHNRVRMITASFLVKDLHIDWRWGEKYFAQQLVDYDPSVNNGNWQWAASTGCDAQPYFRIFNPWRQQEKFDPECLYIKKWIPELRSCNPRDIHHREKSSLLCAYTPCIVDHAESAQYIKSVYKNVT